AVLARVEDRTIYVITFLDRYFATYIEDRPNADSLGRVEFLHNLVNKEVLALIAKSLDTPPTFEDRVRLREQTNSVLQNVLYQRLVTDSIVVTEEQIADAYKQFSYEQHLRRIHFDDRAEAERVHQNLVAGRMTWKQAVAKYQPEKVNDDGDI